MLRNQKSVLIFIVSVFFIMTLYSCKKQTLPELTTTSVTEITRTSAVSGGNITNNGGTEVTARGVCWGTAQNPEISDNKTNDGAGNGTFTSNITGLSPNTTYYVRAYANNSEGTGYGNEVSFTTSPVGVPALTTSSLTSITYNSAVSGGNITDDGGGNITARGVCWNTSPNPTVSNSKTSDGTGTGNFSSNITGLNSGVTYYVRAYATNSSGTGYGNEISFITLCQAPTATTNAATSVGSNTATLNGTINAKGSSTTVTFEYGLTTSYGSTVTATQSPVTGSSNTAVSAGISGLTPGTIYHFRVRGASCGGTVNGGDQQFTTTAAKSTLNHIGISQTYVNLTNSTVLGQITINPSASGKVIVSFDGLCISTPGDRIVLAASNTTSWGISDGSVGVEAYSTDINGNTFSHTRVYDVTPGSHTYYAVAQNYVETSGDGIASIYGSLTVEYIPASNSIVGFSGINRTSVNLNSLTTISSNTINPTVSGKTIVRVDGSCISTPGDAIVLAASNTNSWGVNDGNVYVEAVNSDMNQNSFSHTRVYDVSSGNRTFNAVGQNYVETDGDGIASIYGSLLSYFIPSSGSGLIVGFTGIDRTFVNLNSSTVLGQVTINPSVSGKVLVRFDGECYSSPGDRIVLAASNTTSWGINDGNTAVEAIDTDLLEESFSHTRVYNVTPGSRTFYAIGQNYAETAGDGIASVYGSLTVVFYPD